MKIDLIRHGQVPGNRESRYVGCTEESLTEEGRRAAEIKHLEQAGRVYASPRVRCVETAKILYPETDICIVEELAECDFGRFEYKNYRELDGDPDYQAWIDSGGTIGFPGGEDRETFIRRTMIGFRRVLADAETADCEHIAVVAHGGTIMAILCEVGEPAGDYYRWQSKNLCGYRLEWDEEGRKTRSIEAI